MVELPATKRPTLPMANEGVLYGHVGRYAGQMIMAAFEMLGGVERLVAWAEQNPEHFYTKLFTKIVSRPVQVEHGASESLENVIRALDAKTIDGEVVRDDSDAD